MCSVVFWEKKLERNSSRGLGHNSNAQSKSKLRKACNGSSLDRIDKCSSPLHSEFDNETIYDD